jgi:hypothetical protein
VGVPLSVVSDDAPWTSLSNFADVICASPESESRPEVLFWSEKTEMSAIAMAPMTRGSTNVTMMSSITVNPLSATSRNSPARDRHGLETADE